MNSIMSIQIAQNETIFDLDLQIKNQSRLNLFQIEN